MSSYIDEHSEEFASERGDTSEALASPLISIATPEPLGGTTFAMPEPHDEDGRAMDRKKVGVSFRRSRPRRFL